MLKIAKKENNNIDNYIKEFLIAYINSYNILFFLFFKLF